MEGSLMIVYEFNGKKECNNLIELQEVLKHRSKGNSNEFELRTELEYPFLTILIKEELACVHLVLCQDLVQVKMRNFSPF